MSARRRVFLGLAVLLVALGVIATWWYSQRSEEMLVHDLVGQSEEALTLPDDVTVITQKLPGLTSDAPPLPADDAFVASWTIVDACGTARTVADSTDIELVVVPAERVSERQLRQAQSGNRHPLTVNVACWRDTHPDQAAADQKRWLAERGR